MTKYFINRGDYFTEYAVNGWRVMARRRDMQDAKWGKMHQDAGKGV